MNTPVSAEDVAYWYFRLNGCLQIQNFLIHPDPDCNPSDNQARTEADLIGIRLPWRNEMEMSDDSFFRRQRDKILVYFAEVKAGKKCQINGPWSTPDLQNMPRALRAIGCVPETKIAEVAKELYQRCIFEDERLQIHMFAFGDEINSFYQSQPAKQEVRQVTWDHALTFIHSRFHEYRICKANHDQWPESGKQLWDWSATPVTARFVERVTKQFAKPETNATHSL